MPTEKKSVFEDSGIVSIAFKVISVLGAVVFGGFTWWMSVVWGAQQNQAEEISSMKARLAGLENKVDGISSQVTDVKSGVDTLIKLALRKNQ